MTAPVAPSSPVHKPCRTLWATGGSTVDDGVVTHSHPRRPRPTVDSWGKAARPVTVADLHREAVNIVQVGVGRIFEVRRRTEAQHAGCRDDGESRGIASRQDAVDGGTAVHLDLPDGGAETTGSALAVEIRA